MRFHHRRNAPIGLAWVGLVCVLLAVAGCAHHRKDAATAAAPAEPPTTAVLYVLDTSGWSFIEEADAVYDNGQRLMTLARGHYHAVRLWPGRHELRCGSSPQTVLLFARAGQTYYLRTARDPNMIVSASKQVCGPVAPDEARKIMEEMDKEAELHKPNTAGKTMRPNMP